MLDGTFAQILPDACFAQYQKNLAEDSSRDTLYLAFMLYFNRVQRDPLHFATRSRCNDEHDENR